MSQELGEFAVLRAPVRAAPPARGRGSLPSGGAAWSPSGVDEVPVVARVRNTLQSLKSIPVVLRRAAGFADALGTGYYVFLLAEEGHPELLAVHETRYDGVLAAHRRHDIPFVAHVTVGARSV